MIGEQWAIGDLAECLGGEWETVDGNLPMAGPANGDVLRVTGLEQPGLFLCFAPWPEDSYDPHYFRKLPPADTAADAEWTAEIKRLGQRVFA